jgi:hypothetical protein
MIMDYTNSIVSCIWVLNYFFKALFGRKDYFTPELQSSGGSDKMGLVKFWMSAFAKLLEEVSFRHAKTKISHFPA